MRVHVSVSNNHVAHHNLYQWDVLWSWFVLGNESQLASLYGQPDYKGSWIKRNFTDTGDKCCSRSSTMNPCDPFSSCRCLYQMFHHPENPDTDMGSKKLRKDITTPKRLVHTKHAKRNVNQWLFVLWTHDKSGSKWVKTWNPTTDAIVQMHIITIEILTKYPIPHLKIDHFIIHFGNATHTSTKCARNFIKNQCNTHCGCDCQMNSEMVDILGR